MPKPVVNKGKITRPLVGKCPVCGVHTNEKCKTWCNARDPYDKK